MLNAQLTLSPERVVGYVGTCSLPDEESRQRGRNQPGVLKVSREAITVSSTWLLELGAK